MNTSAMYVDVTRGESVCDIYRYWSLSVIKVERQNNQKWYQYHKYRYFSLLCNGRGNFLYLHMWSKNEPSQNLGPRSRRHMPNKRTPDGAGAPKVGRGGGGRGAGRKRKAENRPGVDAAEAPKRKQQDLGDLFGEPFKKKNTLGDLLGARKDAGAGEGLIKWDYVQHDGGDKDRSMRPGWRSPTPNASPEASARWVARQRQRREHRWTTWRRVDSLHVLVASAMGRVRRSSHQPPLRPRPQSHRAGTRMARMTRIRRNQSQSWPKQSKHL